MAKEKENNLFAGENNEILFASECVFEESSAPMEREAWKILIVDDESDIHTLTKLVLDDYSFEDRGLNFLSAYSGKEAKQMLLEHPNTALILLDVVMETDDAGLEVARYIREDLENHFVRIVLRTGQPGKAPARRVIVDYDINDYKEKTELTAEKLFTTVTSSLRTYRDLRIIEKSRKGLEQIIHSSAKLFEIQSLKTFANGILTQLLSLLRLDESSLYIQVSGFTASKENGDFVILAATGKFENFVDKPLDKVVPKDIINYLNRALVEEKCLFIDDVFIGYFPTRNGSKNILYLNGCGHLSPMDRDLIRIFSTNVAIAFENIYLNKEIVDTQKEVIVTLGEVVENRSHETAYHVRRVAEFSYLLALKACLSEEEAEIIRLASPMHDVGKVGIPDAILFKPGKLSPEEFEKIIPHPTIGYEILKNSTRHIMEAAAIIAEQHHERWNGKGYPKGLIGDEIHIYGRIVALADVFDSLMHKRIYKEAWAVDEVAEFIKKERGKHFDPRLSDVFLEHFDEFIELNNRYPDE
jgi:response regulator RpfG family c-di-GMP phosphodiesterase